MRCPRARGRIDISLYEYSDILMVFINNVYYYYIIIAAGRLACDAQRSSGRQYNDLLMIFNNNTYYYIIIMITGRPACDTRCPWGGQSAGRDTARPPAACRRRPAARADGSGAGRGGLPPPRRPETRKGEDRDDMRAGGHDPRGRDRVLQSGISMMHVILLIRYIIDMHV